MTKFRDQLRIFWGDEQAETWKRKIFPNPYDPNTGVDGAFNLIYLSSDAHKMWNQGAFALRPLDGIDEKKPEVEFVPNSVQA